MILLIPGNLFLQELLSAFFFLPKEIERKKNRMKKYQFFIKVMVKLTTQMMQFEQEYLFSK